MTWITNNWKANLRSKGQTSRSLGMKL